MYTALKGQNYRLKRLLAENAKLDEVTHESGPYAGYTVSYTYAGGIHLSGGSTVDDDEKGLT